MKKITIDVQLTPCAVGVDIFTSTEKLVEVNGGGHYKNENGNCRGFAMAKSEFPELALITKPIKATLTIEVPREEGFYWVNRHADKTENGWAIRYWDGVRFNDGTGSQWSENVYSLIDERKIERLPE